MTATITWDDLPAQPWPTGTVAPPDALADWLGSLSREQLVWVLGRRQDTWAAESDCFMRDHAGTIDRMGQHYSAALDEVYRLRTLLAVEGAILEQHLTYKTFPKSRRGYAEAQVDRMRRAAQGLSEHALAEHPEIRRRQSRADANMPDTLTRWAWEARPAPPARFDPSAKDAE